MAAFAQVQSLTDTLNEYIRVSAHQEISAVSTSLCDECHKNNKESHIYFGRDSRNTESNRSLVLAGATKHTSNLTSICTQTFATVVRNSCGDDTTSSGSSSSILELPNNTFVDDDGYCEIDDLKLASILTHKSNEKTPVNINSSATSSTTNITSELLKRQSTVSADSIPEETEHEIHAALRASNSNYSDTTEGACGDDVVCGEELDHEELVTLSHIEVNDTYDTTSQPKAECNQDIELQCSDTHRRLIENLSCSESSCSANRLIHATSLAPAVPCHLISNYITTLSLQISQLLVWFLLL